MPPNIMVYGADIGLNYGFPFNFYGYGGGRPVILYGQPVPQYFSVITLVLDAAIYYLVACAIVAVYHKSRGTKKQ
jgi:hypothetical protein